MPQPTLTANAKAAHAILEHAEHIGLPLPFHVASGEYDVAFQFYRHDELVDWALYCEATISDHTDAHGNVHYRVESNVLDFDLTMTCCQRQAVPA